jgi:hypothetical protein
MRQSPAQPAIDELSDLTLCRTAQASLYTLAMSCPNADIAGRALFLLSEMEHYDQHTLPTPARRRQIIRFLTSCRNLRQRLEATCHQIPELCDTA